MAVVQISKIQVRRGKKNSNTGVPQLSSAEFAWAVDTQELFIGNGSVAEGAPEVGNTKVLTANDNLIELANAYEFANDDHSISNTQSRSLQSKVDEIQVSIEDFGAVPDGSTDASDAIVNAVNDLFTNADPKYKKVLYIPNGEYLVSKDIQIPSETILRGETQAGAKLNIGSNTITFVTADGLDIDEFTSFNRPRNIEFSNFTIIRTTGSVDISGIFNSVFDGIVLQGEYVLSDTINDITLELPAIKWTNENVGLAVTDIEFKNCVFVNNSLSLHANQTQDFETIVNFDRCEFRSNYSALRVDTIANQKNKWKIANCLFSEIYSTALFFNNGVGTKIDACEFEKTGNGTNDSQSPEVPMIAFEQPTDNVVLNLRTDRQEQAGVTTLNTKFYAAEVQGASKVTLDNTVTADVFLSDAFTPFALLGVDSRNTTIDYTLRIGTQTRFGTLNLLIDNTDNEVFVADDYNYSASTAAGDGANATSLLTDFEFSAELRDNNSDTENDTVVLTYKNPTDTGQLGVVTFGVGYSV